MWLNPQETADLVTFTEEILNEKRHFLCSERDRYYISILVAVIFLKLKYVIWFRAKNGLLDLKVYLCRFENL